jgi:8-oxo-dGTP diphosphatase
MEKPRFQFLWLSNRVQWFNLCLETSCKVVSMEHTHVVTCFLENNQKILILKRSARVGSYQQRWAGVSGYLEPRNTPLQQAREELQQELGLTEADLTLIKEGTPLEIVDEALDKTWVVHPFRFHLLSPDKIRMDWEHTEFRWIEAEAISAYETVPGLGDAWERVC